MTDVLLSYCWVRSTYATLRNLAEHGLRVVVSDSNRIGMCQFSRLKKGFCRYESPFVDEKQFISDIKKIISHHKPALLLPSHDETEVLARHREAFGNETFLPIPDISQLILANDKEKSARIANECELPVPFTLEWKSISDLHGVLKKKTAKYVIKLRKGNSAKGVFYPETIDAAISTVEKLINMYSLSKDRLPIVQEKITGEGWGVSCLYWHGERIVHFTHRRIREKIETGGTSTLREHQPNELLEKMAFRLLDKMKWHGLAMVEFKYNPETNEGWFIEINPRLWGSIHLPISSGVEFPWLLYLCATAGPEAAKKYQASQKIKYPWRSRWYLGDCIVALNKISKGRLLTGLQLLLPGKTDTYDDLHVDDPGGFLGEAGYYLYNFIKYRSMNPVSEGMLG